MADEEESFTTLYDTSWFGTPPHHPPTSPQLLESLPTRTRHSFHQKRSMSDESTSRQRSSKLSSNSTSPVFVPQHPRSLHLSTVYSGQEIDMLTDTTKQPKMKLECILREKKNRVLKQRVYSKSLSELEFEEVKGFMDLGFVFSEEDAEDTDLVSIVPGIQRLGRPRREDDQQKSSGSRSRSVGDSAVPRPYLSESWADDESSNTSTTPLMSWRIPLPRSESDMKRTLRCWAHNVAESIISDDSVLPSSDSISQRR